MRRILLVLGAAALATATFAGVAQATGGSSCASTAEATYQHRFDGAAGTVTITAVRALCEGAEQSFSLVSYTGSGTSGFVYDTDNAWIDSERRSVTLGVDVPGCSTRVEAIIGTGVVTGPAGDLGLGSPSGPAGDLGLGSPSGPAGDLGLGSPSGPGNRSTGEPATYTGDAGKCAPRPSVAFQSYCDGVLHTRLANAPGARVDAVFVIGGKRIRVRPGSHSDLASRPSGLVEVRDNNGAVHVGSWTSPADCAPPETASSSSGITSS